MKIGINAHNLEGKRTGVGRYLVNLLDNWNQLDIPANLEFILYFKSEIPKDIDLSNKFQKKLLSISSNALFMHYGLPKAAKKDEVDWLFCPGYIAPIFYQGKIALALHDIIYQAHPELYNWPSIWDKILLKKFSKISAKKAKIIFTPSEFSRQEVIKHYQTDPAKVFTTLLATDDDFKLINNQGELDKIKGKYKVKNKFILYIGSIFNRRHLPETIKAFEKIAKELTNYQFLIVGANHTSPFIDINGLIKQVNQKLNREAVLHQDYLSGKDLVLLYNAADSLIWLSDYEGFGLPVLEAMACGTPVITSPIASIPEVAGDSAIYIQDNSNINEISEGIYRGLTDKNLRQNLINKGFVQSQKFSWKECAQQTLDALLNSRVK